MYYISSIDKYDIGVTSTMDGVTEFFNRVDLELFLNMGNVVLGAIPYCRTQSLVKGYSYVQVTLEQERQIREEVEFGFEDIKLTLAQDTLFDFMKLYNFKSCSSEFCSEFLVLTYLLQVYNEVTLVVKGRDMFLSVPFSAYTRVVDCGMLTFRIRGEVFVTERLTKGYLRDNTLLIGYSDYSTGFEGCVSVNLDTLGVSIGKFGGKVCLN